MSTALGTKGDIAGNMSDCNIHPAEPQIGVYPPEVMARAQRQSLQHDSNRGNEN